MTDLARDFSALWAATLLPAAAVFLRIAAAVALLPGLGESGVPLRVRLALAIVLTLVVTPAATPVTALFDASTALTEGARGRGAEMGGGVLWLRLLGSETLAGLSLGLALRLMILALQTAGTLAAQAASVAQMFGTNGAEPMPAMAHLLVAAGLALAMIWGLPVRAAAMLLGSYDLWPPGVLPDAATLRHWALPMIGRSFGLAFSLAGPFLIAGVIYNAGLGAINRAMPQLMVAMIGAPGLILGALGLLAVTVPVGLGVWIRLLAAVAAHPLGAPP